MKYSKLCKCLEIIDETCALSKIKVDDGEFSLLNFQRALNAPLEQKARIVFDMADYEIALEVTPKRSDNK